jgi:hypothetical protein
MNTGGAVLFTTDKVEAVDDPTARFVLKGNSGFLA